MDHGNILSGAAFKATVYVLFVALAALFATGTATYFYVKNTMLKELEAQIVEEEILLHEIYGEGGTAALTSAIGDLENPIMVSSNLVGLFTANSLKLAGNITVAPDFVGWRQTRLQSDERRAQGTHFYVKATRIEGLILVMGRSLGLVSATETTLIKAFLGAAIGVAAIILGIGYFTSKQSYRKLEVLESTLDRVSQGATQARVPVSRRNDQIDRISQRVNAHLARLDRLMLSTRTTAASIAHDLKTPLSRAFLSLQEAVNQLDAQADPRDALEETERELLRVNTIFDTILRIARIEAGEGRDNPEPFAVLPMLEDLAETFAPLAEDHGQNLSLLSASDAPVTLVGDERMIRQMVVNLVQNAITHCPPGARIALGAHATQEGVEIEVADTGPGIPESARLDVFDPFYRLDRSRTAGGFGLGLALVRAVADRHGAHVTLSDNAPGLRATILFPNAGARADA